MGASDRTKKLLRYGAFGAIGGAMALSPLGFASADEEPGVPSAPATVTATVTAIVAPEECKPIPDGKLPQQAVDYATDGGPITTAPAPPADDTGLDAPKDSTSNPTSDEEKASAQGSGPFDPYLCEAQGATQAARPSTLPEETGPKLGDIPGVNPTLRPYPNQQGDLTEGQGGGSGVTLGTPDPKATPTENPAPTPGLGAPRPLG